MKLMFDKLVIIATISASHQCFIYDEPQSRFRCLGLLTDGNSLLLQGLRAHSSRPPENDTVHTVRANRKDTHGDITTSGVERGGCDGETDNSDRLACSDVPRTLIVLARGHRHEDRKDTSDEVRRASQDETDNLAEAESLDNCFVSVRSCNYGTVVDDIPEGKKFLKPFADRCMFCMRQKIQTR